MDFFEESVEKSWGKESANESGLKFIPSFDSSFVEFVQPCFCFSNSEEFMNVFKNSDRGTGSRSDNTVDSLHGFIIYWIEISKNIKKVTEIINVENWRIDNSRVLRSPTTIVPSSIPASGALSPTRVDLLPPHKRFRDSYSSDDSIEEDIDADVLADIEGDVAAAEAASDMDVKAGVDVGICIEVGVEEEDKDEHDAQFSDRGTMEVGVNVVVGIDILVGMLMSDVVECLEQLEEGVQGMYKHIMEIPLQWLEEIELGQRELEVRSLIAGGERAGLLDHVMALERSNMRLRDTLRMESIRADRLRFRGLEIMIITRSGMTPEAIKELIAQRVAKALATYEANRVTKLVVDSQSKNGDDADNGNGGGNGDGNGRGNRNGNGGGNRNGNPNGNDRGAMHVACECTYHDFVKCQPLRTEGVVRLTRWFEKMETVFHISNCREKYQVKELMKLMTEVYCPINEIQKMETELWNLTMNGNDLTAYTQRFQELTMFCTKMVLEEEDRVEKFIRGLPDNIQGNVIVVEPTRL
ncbi:putative reverse transcriptase domain-containing protein [Tanacetum coccineum]